MARGPKKHLKRLAAPSHWMLDKLSGSFAPRPSSGPHKIRECLPLILILRNRLKYALTKKEVTLILMQRHLRVDGKVRTDPNFPAGFMDVVQIKETKEDFRLLYDPKGRFTLQRITPEEAKFKLARVTKVETGNQGIPYVHTDDGRTIRYPDPSIKIHDTVKIDIASGKITSFIPFEVNNLCMIVGGHNLGRVGVITSREKHPGSFDIVHITDSVGHQFATRLSNVFVIGKANHTLVSLPAGKGVRRSRIDERNTLLKRKGEKVETSN
ncbi:40S ribosomal protein S4 [Tieghemostelium lacteum]|uniref:40S ribosomal protein S4 n=1 Tax=Tieghemostelium lacteum TaxID=361077 RepID=A0A151ZAJ7_TIELA|nr:40S ribosomal protein S4 [Tieghemostelium lacteum]|eukprot:KYQ90961.1 40S ribosomal protein S4 [Tieghemostelium lacteum]